MCEEKASGCMCPLHSLHFGQICVMYQAVTLLRDSTLPDGILHEIWEIADAPGEGYLLEAGFHIALKLVALKQAGHPIDAVLLVAFLACCQEYINVSKLICTCDAVVAQMDATYFVFGCCLSCSISQWMWLLRSPGEFDLHWRSGSEKDFPTLGI